MTDLRDSIARLSLEQSHKLLNQLAGHTNVSELVRAGVQAALAPPPPAAPQGAVLGKDKSFWSELTTVEQAAAAVLGYSAQVWDAGGDTTATAQPWASLQNEERIAAQRLGYTEAVWEEDRRRRVQRGRLRPGDDGRAQRQRLAAARRAAAHRRADDARQGQGILGRLTPAECRPRRRSG